MQFAAVELKRYKMTVYVCVCVCECSHFECCDEGAVTERADEVSRQARDRPRMVPEQGEGSDIDSVR